MNRESVPPLLYAESAGARLGYQVWGEGPNIVGIPPMAQNIEAAWEWKEIREMLEEFGSFGRYLAFDKRGTGTSTRRSKIPGIDERVEDLKAVMDAAGFETAHLFACSEGGPMAIMFAVTYPDRVQSLTFHGAYPAQVATDVTEEELSEMRKQIRAYAALWGTDDSPVARGFAPSLAENDDYVSWHRRYERLAADTDALIELLDLTLEMDVREVLPRVEAPTLVLHRKGDRVVPIQWGRELAAGIPGARLVELEGNDHFQYAGDVQTWMDEFQRFVTGTVTERKPRMSTVRIETLGHFRVLVDGVEVPASDWGSRHARQILKRLIAARGWPVTRDQLIDMCWPEESDMRRLSARLSVQLSLVRKVLSGGVVADRSSVRLDLDHVSVDLEQMLTAADVSEALELFQGDFLPDDVYEDWSVGVRDEARSHFFKSAEKIVEAEPPETRESIARRMIEVDRYDFRGHEILIEALQEMDQTRLVDQAKERWAAVSSELI